MRLRFAGLVLCAMGLAGLGCQSGYSMYPAVQGCSEDAGHCGGDNGGGVTPGTGGSTSGTGTGGASTNLVGNVDLINAPTFQDTGTVFTGAANIVALPQGGGMVETTYGGTGNGAGGGSTGSATFDLMNLPTKGGAWILVQDTSNGNAGILSTFSFMSLPEASQVTLPVLGQGLLTNIGSNLPSVLIGGVSPLAAQVVLVVQHLGAPYQGLAVSGGAGSAHVVYDTGAGSYSDSATATGTAGTIILFNAALTGLQNISFTDTATMAVYTVGVQTGTGAATLGFIAL